MDQDRYEIGRDFPRGVGIELAASPDGRRIVAAVAQDPGGPRAHFLREPSGQWRQIARFQDKVLHAEFGRDPIYIEAGQDDALYLLSRADAPKGKILRLPFQEPDLTKAALMVAEGTNVIRDFRATASGLALVFLNGGQSELGFHDFFEKRLRSPSAPAGGPRTNQGSVQDAFVPRADEIWFRDVSYTSPYAWHLYNPTRDIDSTAPTALAGKSPRDFGDIEIVRELVTSKDGTKVPLNILGKRGVRLNGENPTLLTGYGGYGVSLEPSFDPARRMWFDQGGVIAVANLRGGGEFGEDWHQAGNLTRKQNVFDDFIACAEFLVRSNYTKPARLAIESGGHGGLLMGAVLTQRPDLVGAVVSHAGLYDMLRGERDASRRWSVTEFGSTQDPDQFRALHDYSPFHRVRDGTNSPICDPNAIR